MVKSLTFIVLIFIAGILHAQEECDSVRKKGLRLLPKTTFNVSFPMPLHGCFTAYLPENEKLEDGLYEFGIFRDGELITALPVIEAGRDLGSHPFRELKILAVSFNDINGDGRRDITVMGQRLIANGERIFTQLYWGCNNNFFYEDEVNTDINWDFRNLSKINIKIIQNYVRKKRFTAQCGVEN